LLLPQVPAPFNLEAVMKAKADDPSALHVVLFQEVRRQLRAATSTPDPSHLTHTPVCVCVAAHACVPCRRQIERYNALLVLVRRSCVELVKGIKGLVVMSADVDKVRVVF
jgi:dynein heavy chain